MPHKFLRFISNEIRFKDRKKRHMNIFTLFRWYLNTVLFTYFPGTIYIYIWIDKTCTCINKKILDKTNTYRNTSVISLWYIYIYIYIDTYI